MITAASQHVATPRAAPSQARWARVGRVQTQTRRKGAPLAEEGGLVPHGFHVLGQKRLRKRDPKRHIGSDHGRLRAQPIRVPACDVRRISMVTTVELSLFASSCKRSLVTGHQQH